MKRLNIILLVLLSMLNASLAYGQSTGKMIDKAQKKHPSYALMLLFPVNVVNEKINLKVEIPKNFKKLDNANSDLLEFIPATDKDPYAWSEIITVIPYIGKRIKAKEIVKTISEGIKQGGQNAIVLEEKYTSNGQYDEAYAVIGYTNQSRMELIKMYAASGPYDSVVVQYTIHIKSHTDDFRIPIDKVDNYFKNHVRIIK